MKRRVIRVSDVQGFSPPGAEASYVSRMLVDDESVGAKRLTVNHFTLFPGQKTYKGSHPEPYEEVYYLLRGRAVLTLMPCLPESGANTLYDARKAAWGTSFRLVEQEGRP